MVGAIIGVSVTNFFPTSVVCVAIIGIVADSFRKIFSTYRKREQDKKNALETKLLEKKDDQEMPEVKKNENKPVNVDGKYIPASCPDPVLLNRLIKRERK